MNKILANPIINKATGNKIETEILVRSNESNINTNNREATCAGPKRDAKNTVSTMEKPLLSKEGKI